MPVRLDCLTDTECHLLCLRQQLWCLVRLRTTSRAAKNVGLNLAIESH